MLYCKFCIYVFENRRFMFNFMKNIKICKFSSFTLFCRILFFSRCSCILRTNLNTLSQALHLKWLRVAYQAPPPDFHDAVEFWPFQVLNSQDSRIPHLFCPVSFQSQEDYSRSHHPCSTASQNFMCWFLSWQWCTRSLVQRKSTNPNTLLQLEERTRANKRQLMLTSAWSILVSRMPLA